MATLGEIYEALKRRHGDLSAVADDLDMERHQVQRLVDETPELAVVCNDLRQSIVDKAEQTNFDLVRKGDAGASRFILSTLGRDRGYITGVAGVGKDGEIMVTVKQFAPSEEKPDGA